MARHWDSPCPHLTEKMASQGNRSVRPGECQQIVIRFVAPDGRVHSMPREEFERRRKEEAEKLKTKLAINDLKVACESRLVKVTWEPCAVSPCQYAVRLQASGAKSAKTVYQGADTNYEVGPLQPGQSYSLHVSASLDPVQGEESTAQVTVPPEPPSKPRRPRFTTKSKSAITLKWAAPENNGSSISNYELKWVKHDSEGFVPLYLGGETQFKLVHQLDSSLRFQFRLRAKNEVGWSEWNEFEYRTEMAVPGKPPPPAITDIGVTFIRVQWEEIKSCDGHVITYKLEMEDPTSGYGFQTVYQGEDCHWKQEHLFRNSCYKFRLYAVNERGAGPHSEVVEGLTHPDKPGPPAKLRPQTVKSREIVIVWDPPADNGGSPVSTFIVEVWSGSERRVLKVEESEVAVHSLAPGVPYQVRIAATSDGGQGEWSKTCKVTTATERPSEPLAVAIMGSPRQHSITLCWDPPTSNGGAPIVHYTIESCTETLPWKVVGVASGDAFESHDQPHDRSHDQSVRRNHTVGSLTPGHSYGFRVKCQNSTGDSPWSPVVWASTAPGVPGQPHTVSVTPRGPTSVVFHCQCRDDFGSRVVSYNLRYWRQEEGEDGAKRFKEVASVGDTITATSLLPAHEYHYCLQAVNAVGVGQWGVAASFSTPPSSPSQVGGVKAVKRTANGFTVVWSIPLENGSPISNFHIECGDRIVAVEGTQTELAFSDLRPDTTYRVRCQAENQVGKGPLSTPLTVKTLPPPPAPPTLSLLSATPTFLKLSWDKKQKKSPSEITYKLELLQEGSPTGALVYEGAGHSFKVSRLTPNQHYQFRVAAANEAGVGPWGSPVTFSTLPALPDPPNGFTVCCDALPVVFSWQPSPERQDRAKFHYEVQLSVDGGEYTQVCSTSGVQCSHEGCQPGPTYTARLRVVGEEPVTYGKFTESIQFRVPPPQPVVEDIQPDISQAAEPLEGRTTSSSLSAVVPQKILAPLLFVVISGLVLVLAFVLGVYFQF